MLCLFRLGRHAGRSQLDAGLLQQDEGEVEDSGARGRHDRLARNLECCNRR